MSAAHPTGSDAAEADRADDRTADETGPGRDEILDRSLRLGGALVAVLGALLTWDLLVGTWQAVTGQVTSLYLWLGAAGTHVFGVDPLGIAALVGLSVVAGLGTVAAGVRTARETLPVLGMAVAGYWALGAAPTWWLAALPLAAYVGLAATGPLRVYLPDADPEDREARREPASIAAVLLVGAALIAVVVGQGWFASAPADPVVRVALVVGAIGATVGATQAAAERRRTIAIAGAAAGAAMVLAGVGASVGAALAVVGAVVLAFPERAREAMEGVPDRAPTREPSTTGDRPAGLRPGAVFEDRYEVESRLGADGTGRTFRARDGLVGRDVVLKELSVQDRPIEPVLRDLHAAASLDDPHLASLHDVVRLEDRTVLVVEHVPAGSLEDRLREGPLGRDRALAVADQVLAGLDALHRIGVVHGNLAPENVLFDADDTVKLTDVGIHRLRDGDGDPYRAPEDDPDARADLYAVGALLAEMVTGDPRADVGMDDDIASLLGRATAADPDDRFADAGTMRRAVDEIRR